MDDDITVSEGPALPDTTRALLRGALGTTLVWGGGFAAVAALGMTLFALLNVVGVLPGGFSLEEALVLVFRVGVVGAVAGVAFSTLIRVMYRGRSLSELSWVRFGIGGGILTGLIVPLFLQTMNLISGDGLVAWELVLDDGLWAGVLGSVAAGGSILLAQLADRMLPNGGQDQADLLED